jgi:hypothetical protein
VEKHKELPMVNKTSTNYEDSRESYNLKPTPVDIDFSTMIANNLDNNPDPKTMAMAELKECSLRLDSIKGCNPRRNNHAQ